MSKSVRAFLLASGSLEGEVGNIRSCDDDESVELLCLRGVLPAVDLVAFCRDCSKESSCSALSNSVSNEGS